MNKIALVVLGMHRSGTSALTAALGAAGWALPLDAMPPQPDNPEGFHESIAIATLNDRLLEAKGSSWKSPSVVSLEFSNHDVEDARRTLRAAYSKESLICIKDPRILLLPDLWHLALLAEGFQPKYVLALRHPIEVAASLGRRDPVVSRDGALRLWMRYALAIAKCSGEIDEVVQFDALLENPRECVKNLAVDVDIERLSDVDKVVKPELRHHRADLINQPGAPQSVMMAYETLTRYKRGSFDQLKEALRHVREMYLQDSFRMEKDSEETSRTKSIGIPPGHQAPIMNSKKNYQIDLKSAPITESIPLFCLEDWIEFRAANKELFTSAAIETIIDRISARGYIHPLTQEAFCGADLDIRIGNLRESIVHRNICSRHRAVMLSLSRCWNIAEVRSQLRVYAPEAITPFAKEFSEFFSSFIGSEYLPDDASKKRIPDVLHQDLLNLTFEDSSLDVVITNDVLEHVPSIDTCLSEIYRVLAPGGWHLGTHPFAMGGKNSIVRATITNGEIQFSGEAEYHGNPVDPEGGSLVFEVPGWDILERAKKAGFSIAEMRFIVNENAGVLSNIGGIFVLCLQK